MIRTGDSDIRDELWRSKQESADKEVTSAKNPLAREPGFLAFVSDKNEHSSDSRMNRSRRFDQVIDDMDDFYGGYEDDLQGEEEDICAPIQCNEDDDGPDFSRMVKKSASE